MLNSTMLTGRLTKDPELKYLPDGAPVCNFTLAVARNYKNANGEYEADFINCVVWRELAEIMGDKLTKGSLIGLRGRLQTRTFESEGKRVYITEVRVEEFTFLEPKREKEEVAAAPPTQYKSKYKK